MNKKKDEIDKKVWIKFRGGGLRSVLVFRLYKVMMNLPVC